MLIRRTLSIGIASLCLYLGADYLNSRVESSTAPAQVVKQTQDGPVQKTTTPQPSGEKSPPAGTKSSKPKAFEAAKAPNQVQQPEESVTDNTDTNSVKTNKSKKSKKTTRSASKLSPPLPDVDPVDEQSNHGSLDTLADTEAMLDDIAEYTNK